MSSRFEQGHQPAARHSNTVKSASQVVSEAMNSEMLELARESGDEQLLAKVEALLSEDNGTSPNADVVELLNTHQPGSVINAFHRARLKMEAQRKAEVASLGATPRLKRLGNTILGIKS